MRNRKFTSIVRSICLSIIICCSEANCVCVKSFKNSKSALSIVSHKPTYPAVLDLSPTKLLALPAAGATALFNAYPEIIFCEIIFYCYYF